LRADTGQEIVEDELRRVAVESEQREQPVSEFDEHAPAWTHQGCHVFENHVVVAHMRHYAHGHESIEEPVAENVGVGGGILNIGPEDMVRVHLIFPHAGA
jgi:hypothetical protein